MEIGPRIGGTLAAAPCETVETLFSLSSHFPETGSNEKASHRTRNRALLRRRK
jgi:hypothetical protein